jgi:Uma2 family endonuclease
MSSVEPARHAWTYGDLVALPDDRLRHELIDGEHVVSPSPGTSHQLILWHLTVLLDQYLCNHPVGVALGGPYDVKFSWFTVLVPDLVYFTAERYARVVNEKYATAAPDLVVEILSPGTRRRDKGHKRAVYDREGVREYWIVDPSAQSVMTLRRPRPDAGLTDVQTLTLAADDVLESPVFPGLSIPLRDLFLSR